jgi:antitoxin VapB
MIKGWCSMNMVTTKAFRNGGSEAVRLPKEMEFGLHTELIIAKTGNVVTIRPKPEKSMAEMVARLRALGMPNDGVQKRLPVLAPERSGL